MAQNNFVQQQHTRLVINKKPYHFIGTNMWYANLLAMPDNNGGDRKRLLKELDFLKQQGITNIRVLVGAQGQGKIVKGIQPVHPALQIAPGKYNNDLMDGMDFLLQQLQKRKMYGVFFFSNNWEWSGGFLQYMNWHNKIDDTTMARNFSWDENRDIVSRFYSCDNCIEDYRGFVKMILNHTNKLTGKKYIDEPGIMAWEIANEPRPMRPFAIEAYKDFLVKTSALVKSMDPNHLLTIGVEGYLGTETMQVFEDIHKDKNVDYATIHIWPKNWGWYKDSSFKDDFSTVVQKTTAYINEHAIVMQKIDKPLVVEEFGLPRDNFSFALNSPATFRNKYYGSVFSILNKSKKENAVIAGVNFWAFGGYAKPPKNKDPFWKEGDDLTGDPPMEEQGLNSVFAGDSATWKLIFKYAQLLK
ncbi:glycoside hydrolase 5 family protein [Ferruginibacter sp. SUN106]|uniref:glycoside hydrolase 5 family protein n=1 Tax=Ferruginibacter sp. SUN106 TaxID=2978348 RepID=UPI003D35C2EA